MEASLILLTLMSVPLAAILGSYYLKAKKIGRAADFKELNDKVQQLLAEQAVQRHRIETLETIVVADSDRDTRMRFRREGVTLPSLEEADDALEVAKVESARGPNEV